MKLKGILPTPNALVVFEAAARLLSFSAAGRELSIAQPAVTRHIRNLENDLQVQLFERRNNAVHLTDDGQQFFETVSDGLSDIASHANALRRREGQSVTIGSTFGLANLWLAPRLPALRRTLKDTPVNLLISDLYEDYDARGVDFSIRFGSGQWPGMVSTLLMHETIVPVASPTVAGELNLEDPDNWHRAALLDLDMPGINHGWANWENALHHWTDMEPAIFSRTSLDSYLIVMDAAKRGEGIALGQLGLVDDMLDRAELVVVGRRINRAPMGYYLVRWPQKLGAERAVEAILRTVE